MVGINLFVSNILKKYRGQYIDRPNIMRYHINNLRPYYDIIFSAFSKILSYLSFLDKTIFLRRYKLVVWF